MTAQKSKTSKIFSSPPTPPASSTPKYFAAHQYEYEVSPEQSTNHPLTPKAPSSPSSSTVTKQQSPYIITETSLPMTKTIYLIRHAESDENRRKECLKTSVQGLGKLKLPKREDVVASMELMNVGAQLDSDVSPRGQAQIDQIGKRIAKDDFVRKMGIQLVAHSPLQRARRTSYGMLQCVAPATNPNANSKHKDKDNNSNGNNNNNNNNPKDDATNDDPTIQGAKHPSVKRVIELDILSERTPIEWLPIQHDQFTKRIAEFEMWLCQQPEDVIAVVGHSLYFKNMLGLESKFHNVDVWSLEFDFTVENSVQKVKRDVHVANESVKKKMIQKHFENFGSIIQKTKRTASGGCDGDILEEDDVHPSNVEQSSDGSEKRDEHESCSSANLLGIQTTMDGVSLEEVELPRGWRQLKHHYRYDPDYIE